MSNDERKTPARITLSTAVQTVEDDPLLEQDPLVEEDLLVEEVSIDGMCGVY